MKKQRWLVLAHCFNMDGQAASHHITDKIPYLIKRGIEPVVVTAATGYPDRKVEHHQVTSLAPSGLRFELRHIIKNKVKIKLLAQLLKGISSIGLFPLYIVEKIFIHLDSQWSWFQSAEMKGAQLMRANSFDMIYVSGGASSAFLAAHRLSKRFDVPWIAEIYDPMVNDAWGRSRMAYRWNLWLESIICNNARAAFWFTKEALIQARNRNPRLSNRGHLMRPGMIPPNFGQVTYERGEKLRLSYFGGLTPERNLKLLCNALGRLFAARPNLKEKIEVHVYGGKMDVLSQEAFGQLPKTVLKAHGRLEYDESTGKSGRQRVLEAMRQSDALVLMHGLGDICKLYLPSKIYEYLWTQRPVLVFSPVPDHWAEILDPSIHFVVQQSDVTEVDAALEKLINLWENDELPDLSVNQAYSVEQAVEQLVSAAQVR
jgi:glycosyltransferase involved in cell wall biosynthesis